MLRIKILGIGCARHKALRANLKEAIRKYPVHAILREVTEVNELMRYGISATPALVINGEVVLEDVVPSVEELVNLLQEWSPLIDNRAQHVSMLVPTDFSSTSENAFKYALNLAPHFKSGLKVVHVSQPDLDPLISGVMGNWEHQEDLKKKRLNKFVDDIQTKVEGGVAVKTNVRTQLVWGFPRDEILSLAANEKPEMIVMGTSGTTGLAVKIFGSISAEVSRMADCPVLLVPPGVNFTGIRNILYAGNYNGDDEIIINRVIELGRKFSACFHIVHVKTRENGYYLNEQDFKAVFEQHAPESSFKFRMHEDPDVAGYLNRYVLENDIDLVVMLTRHRSYWQNMMHQSTIRKMSSLTSKPILVLHFDL